MKLLFMSLNFVGVKIDEKDFIIEIKSDQYEPELDEDDNLETPIVINYSPK